MSRQMARAPKRRRLNAREEEKEGEMDVEMEMGQGSESRPGRAAASFGGVGRMLGK